MVFCNSKNPQSKSHQIASHNPYFNRWFSAIISNYVDRKNKSDVTILILIDGFLQYCKYHADLEPENVTILILIDGFLQYGITYKEQTMLDYVTILILIDGFLQFKLLPNL